MEIRGVWEGHRSRVTQELHAHGEYAHGEYAHEHAHGGLAQNSPGAHSARNWAFSRGGGTEPQAPHSSDCDGARVPDEEEGRKGVVAEGTLCKT